MDARIYPMAPMSMLFRVSTVMLMGLPVLFIALGFVPVVGPLMLGLGLFIAALYAFTWLWMRPGRFVVSSEGLAIEWPLRRRVIAAADLGEARVVSYDAFRDEYGYGVRVGAGGLWGGFGQFRTGSQRFSFYVSRMSDLVMVPVAGALPLLITPADPGDFVARVNALSPELARTA